MANERLLTVRLHTVSGIPKDDSTNDFAFGSAGAWDDTKYELHENAVIAFYQDTPAEATHSLLYYFSKVLSLQATLNWYDISATLDGSPHGSPVRTQTTLLGPDVRPVGADLPEQVSTCLSFHSFYGTDVEFGVGTRPRARDRGRIYIGPLAAVASVTNGTTGRTSVIEALQVTATQAALELATAADAWSIWSRTDATLKPIEAMWMDDAFDVQRRRQEDAQSRTSVVF